MLSVTTSRASRALLGLLCMNLLSAAFSAAADRVYSIRVGRPPIEVVCVVAVFTLKGTTGAGQQQLSAVA